MRCVASILSRVPPTYHTHGRVTATTLPVSNYTAEAPHLRAGARLEFATGPDLLFQPRPPPASSGSERRRLGGSAGVGTPRALQGSREALKKQTSHTTAAAAAAELQGASTGGLPPDPHRLPLPRHDGPSTGSSRTSVCLSMCLHGQKCARSTWKHTVEEGAGGDDGKWCQKRQKKKKKEKQAKEKKSARA